MFFVCFFVCLFVFVLFFSNQPKFLTLHNISTDCFIFACGLHSDISLFAPCFYTKQKMFESPNVINEMEPLSYGCNWKVC